MSFWKISDAANGVFSVNDAHKTSGLYFPLTNTQGSLFSCITPYLSGDIKTSINAFLNYPQSIYDLNTAMATRSLWIKTKKEIINTSPIFTEPDTSIIKAGPIFHVIENTYGQLSVKTLSFVPEGHPAELMQITITNTGSRSIDINPIFAMPLFCRSADNYRDHRHVTSLLARCTRHPYGVINKPTMNFDERGHTVNKMNYFVFGYKDGFHSPSNVVTTLDAFLGEDGTPYKPRYIYAKKTFSKSQEEGKEPCAVLDFGKIILAKDASTDLCFVMGMTETDPLAPLNAHNSTGKISLAFEKSKKEWAKIYHMFNIEGDEKFNFWAKWVNMQPTLRKVYGCSFLPHFDYGRGGRGWRDLWQDLLGLLMFDPCKTRQTLINNFKGVRIDGSNATIITNKGGFLADRNKISRTWMDHGVWPYITLKLYIDQTGDTDILFEQIPYFKDNLLKRAKENDPNFPEQDNVLRTKDKKPYKANILEHTLAQNLVQFFNVGDHGSCLLEGADWNDGLDMGHLKGESVAFTFMYTHNLRDIAGLLDTLFDKGIEKIELTSEIEILLDSTEADYSTPGYKKFVLQKYLDSTARFVSGSKKTIPIKKLIDDLNFKADFFESHLRKKEWMPKLGIFNGYYDNAGKRVEGNHKKGPRITLTSGVFALMSGVATDSQCKKVYLSLAHYLQEKKYGTFRLNTDFKEVKLNMGRAFAFSYGNKENGAIFAHMNVMFAFGLFKRGLVHEGYSLLNGLFKLSTGDDVKNYPCISEYYNNSYRGLYSFLTGSASWMTYLLVTELFGVKHNLGDLTITPKLVKAQFKRSTLKFRVKIDGKDCTIIYKNPNRKTYNEYNIVSAAINNIVCQTEGKTFTIEKKAKEDLLNKRSNVIELVLD